MRNLDAIQNERAQIFQDMSEAVQNNDVDSYNQAVGRLADSIGAAVMADARELMGQQDANILAARGCRVLTSEERQYYEALAEAFRSDNPRQALTGTKVVLPETVIESVFDDLTSSHPLLAAIDFRNTGALIKLILSTTGGAAVWGKIDKAHGDELSASFTEIDLMQCALTAWVPVKKYLLDLGPQWLDRYVRELLGEALAVALEEGIVKGNGKDQPIGMMKKLTGAVDGVYPDKTAVEVTDLSPTTFGALLGTLSKGPNGKTRSIAEVLLIVNPADYFTKVYPATTVRATDGTFRNDVLPFPARVIQSAAVPEGKAVVGLGNRYFMGLGTPSGGKLEQSDEAHWLERERLYGIFLYGYGQALDENAFVVLDISKLNPAYVNVFVVAAGEDTTASG